MEYPDGETLTTTYNADMQTTSVIGTSAYAQTIAYDSANRMIQLIRGANKIDTVYTFNSWNADAYRPLFPHTSANSNPFLPFRLCLNRRFLKRLFH